MALATYIFQGGQYKIWTAADVNPTSDTLKMALFTSSLIGGGGSPVAPTTIANCLAYSNLASFGTYTLLHALVSAGVEATGTGYTVAGATLAGVAFSIVPSSSAPAWSHGSGVGTVYAYGQIVSKVSDNGHCYRCIAAGTGSATTEPTWPTSPGLTVVDVGATWQECGSAYGKFTFTAPTWVNSTTSAQYAVVYDDTSSSKWNLFLLDFGATVSTTNGTYTVTPDATYGLIQLPLL